MPRKLPVCYLVTLMVVYVFLQTPDTMVSMSNLDDIPALDMYPPSDAPGYYRNESPDILKVSPVQPFHDKDGKSIYRGPYDERSLHRAPYDTPLPPTPDHIPPSTADSTDTYAPGYYLQRVRRKQMSVSNTCTYLLACWVIFLHTDFFFRFS